MNKITSNAVIALGANLKLRGLEPKVTLQSAIDALSRQGVMIRAVSRYFETPCFPAGAGPDYVNAAALIETEKTPAELLELLHSVEHEFGRERIQRWGMRTLDLDLVSYGDLLLPDQAEFERWLTLFIGGSTPKCARTINSAASAPSRSRFRTCANGRCCAGLVPSCTEANGPRNACRASCRGNRLGHPIVIRAATAFPACQGRDSPLDKPLPDMDSETESAQWPA